MTRPRRLGSNKKELQRFEEGQNAIRTNFTDSKNVKRKKETFTKPGKLVKTQ